MRCDDRTPRLYSLLALVAVAAAPCSAEDAVPAGELSEPAQRIIRLLADGDVDEAFLTAERELEVRRKAAGSDADHVVFECLNLLAAIHKEAGAHERARQRAQEALASGEALFGEESSELLTPLYLLREANQVLGDHQANVPIAERSLRLSERQFGPASMETSLAETNLGLIFVRLGKTDDARAHLRKALEIARAAGEREAEDVRSLAKLVGELDMKYLTESLNRSRELRNAKQYAEAIDCYEKLSADAAELTGPTSRYARTAVAELAFTCSLAGRFAAAMAHNERLLAIDKQTDRDNWTGHAKLHYEVGLLAVEVNDFAKAAEHLEQALELLQLAPTADEIETARVYEARGKLNLYEGNLQQAKQDYLRALSMRQRLKNSGAAMTLALQAQLAGVLTRLGDLHGARLLLTSALAEFDTASPLDETLEWRLTQQKLLHEHGVYLLASAEYSRAVEQLKKAATVSTSIEGPRSLLAADCAMSLGEALAAVGRPQEAVASYSKALDAYRAHYGERHLRTCQALAQLALALKAQGDFGAAAKRLEEAMAIDQQLFAQPTLHRGALYTHQASLALAADDLMSAKRRLLEALETYTAAYGADSPALIERLEALAQVAAELKDWKTMGNCLDRSRKLSLQWAFGVLPGLPQDDQLRFLLFRDRANLQRAVSLAIDRSGTAAMASKSAEWVLNGKAISQEVMTLQLRQLRQQTAPEASRIAQHLADIDAHTAFLAMTDDVENPTTPEVLKKIHRQHLDGRAAYTMTQIQLHERIERLAQQRDALLVEASRLARTPPRAWIELESAQAAIPESAALIEFYRVDPPPSRQDPPGRQASMYVAWVIPSAGAGDVTFVPLGDAEEIDALIGQVHADMHTFVVKLLDEANRPDRQKRISQRIDIQRETEIALKPLVELKSRLFAPLEQLVQGKQELIICPDSQLWQVPWCALPVNKDGRYLVEDYAITLLDSGRQLAVAQATASPGGPPAIFADPTFDLSPEQVAEALSATPSSNSVTARNLSPLPEVFGPRRPAHDVARLQRSMEEALVVSPFVEEFTGQEPRIYRRSEALESVVKQLKSPRVLMFVTHGFIEEPQADRWLESAPPSQLALLQTIAGPSLDQPLLRCGVLMAGCKATNAGAGAAGDDGVLTGAEVVNMNLQGTELVVLSACKTGLGRVHDGEGVAGLRLAFQLAGADAVISTLWNVLDDPTIMGRFFQHLAAGRSKAEALRRAQLEYIQTARTIALAAHPYFWAAYSVTGR